MLVKLRFVALLLAILVSFPESGTAIITKSLSPSYAVEGQNLTLEWTYTLHSSIGSAKFSIVNDDQTEVVIGRSFSPGIMNFSPEYLERFKLEATDSRAELRILAVQRSDEETYRLNIEATGDDSILEEVILVVNFSSSITNITGKTVMEGGNVNLNCSAKGKPKPTITWTRLSDNRVVTMPLINIRRHDEKDYRCTAENGVGTPATRDVTIDVQYPTEATGPGENATEAEGGVKMFSCPVDGNPEPNITWYSEKTGRTILSGKQLVAEKSGCYTCVARNTVGPPVNITQCLIIIINAFLTTVPPSTMSPDAFLTTVSPSTMSAGGAVEGRVMIVKEYSKDYQSLDSGPSKEFVAWFVGEMDKIYMNMPEYYSTEVIDLRPGSVIVHFILYFKTAVTPEKGLENLRAAISSNDSYADFPAKDLLPLSDESTTSATPGSPKPIVSAGPPWTIVGTVAGGVVLLVILVSVLTWRVQKQRCRNDTKSHNSDLERQSFNATHVSASVERHDGEGGYSQVQGAYAQSGPPAANGTDAAAEWHTEGVAAIPAYAVVDKPKKKKKLREEAPPVYAEVDKSKKKKKKVDDKNLYETLDEPKKARKPGELLYADLGDFQNPAMSTVSISPQPLPAIKIPEAYERTDYADIAQFLKGNAALPQNDVTEDTEMKPKLPSKKKVQGKDNETPI